MRRSPDKLRGHTLKTGRTPHSRGRPAALVQCRATDRDGGLTLNQRWAGERCSQPEMYVTNNWTVSPEMIEPLATLVRHPEMSSVSDRGRRGLFYVGPARSLHRMEPFSQRVRPVSVETCPISEMPRAQHFILIEISC